MHVGPSTTLRMCVVLFVDGLYRFNLYYPDHCVVSCAPERTNKHKQTGPSLRWGRSTVKGLRTIGWIRDLKGADRDASWLVDMNVVSSSHVREHDERVGGKDCPLIVHNIVDRVGKRLFYCKCYARLEEKYSGGPSC